MGSPHWIWRWRVLRPYLPVALVVMKLTIMLSVHVTHYNLSLPMIANSKMLNLCMAIQMLFRCLIHSGVSSVRWIRSHMEDWPVLLITHFAWKWQRTFLWARSTSSEGCQRTQRSPHGGTTPFMNTEHKPWSTRWTWYRTSSSKQSTTLQRLKWHCRKPCEWPKQCQREEL